MPFAPTPCLDPDCWNEATYQGRCPDHQLRHWTPARRERLPSDWATRCRIVMARDHGICHLCGQPGADSIDHVKAGDDHSLENLAPAHLNVEPNCHRYKSSAEGHAARRALATKPRF